MIGEYRLIRTFIRKKRHWELRAKDTEGPDNYAMMLIAVYQEVIDLIRQDAKVMHDHHVRFRLMAAPHSKIRILQAAHSAYTRMRINDTKGAKALLKSIVDGSV